MQFYRIPELIEAKCNVVVWLDGTVQIKTGAFLESMADRAARGQNFVAYVQHGRKGGVGDEAMRSAVHNKYMGKWGDAFGQHQHTDMQFQHYLWMGFKERWFEATPWFKESMGIDENFRRYGVFVTCMVMFDLRQKATKPFLDCWWMENILRSTQDQVSFPYCAWKHNVAIHALPDKEAPVGWYEENECFLKLQHGQ
jgi:hypothetical protein